jgi:hypothetical protein
MNYRRALLVVLSLTLIASATEKGTLRIKVLDSETHSVVIDDSGVPKNCDQVNFDAYCNNSKTTQVTNTMLVQEGDQPPFRIRCSVDTKWSRCMPLPKGETFDARPHKRGIVVYFEDDKGKARSQLFTLVTGSLPQAPANAATAEPVSSSRSASGLATSTPPSSAILSPTPSVAASNSPDNSPGNVKCNFSSTPSGAEITIDGKYVGSTPSEIAVSAGAHAVTVSLPGFSQWKRDLNVTPGSGVISVSASLEKLP